MNIIVNCHGKWPFAGLLVDVQRDKRGGKRWRNSLQRKFCNCHHLTKILLHFRALFNNLNYEINFLLLLFKCHWRQDVLSLHSNCIGAGGWLGRGNKWEYRGRKKWGMWFLEWGNSMQLLHFASHNKLRVGWPVSWGIKRQQGTSSTSSSFSTCFSLSVVR